MLIALKLNKLIEYQ